MNIWDIKSGSKVKGKYYGTSYVGTVTKTQPHSINWNWQQIFIDLDNPILVYGDVRNRILVSIIQGKENSSTVEYV